jgi:hypothetical protein
VGWGKPGPTPTRELCGLYARRLDGKKGALGTAQRARQTLDFWKEPGVYALYRGDEPIYAGQAEALGERLLAHHQQDHLAGRWDTFSWVSPTEVEEIATAASTTLRFKSRASSFDTPHLKAWLDEIEALTIMFAWPMENRQVPALGEHVWSFEQVRSQHAELTVEEMLRAVYDKQMLDT